MNLRIFSHREALVAGIVESMARVTGEVLAPAIGFAGPLAIEAVLEYARTTDRPALTEAIRARSFDDHFGIVLETSGDAVGWAVSAGEQAWVNLGVSTVDLLIIDAFINDDERVVARAAVRATTRWIVAAGRGGPDVASAVSRWDGFDSAAPGETESTWWFIDVEWREAIT